MVCNVVIAMVNKVNLFLLGVQDFLPVKQNARKVWLC